MFKLLGKLFLIIMGLGVLAAVLGPQMHAPRQTTPATTNSPQKPAEPIDPASTPPSVRMAYADDLERNYLDKGMDVHVQVNGKKKDTITLKYVLISRPAVYKIQKDGKLLDEMRQLGFRKAVFADGFDTSWTFDLTK